MSFVIHQEGDAMAMLSYIGTAAHVRKLLECCGMSVEMAAVNSARSKGGRHFWADVAKSVSHQMTPDGSMLVGATHFAAGFKQTGGIISAPGQGAGSLNRKALTIPVGIARERRWDTDEAEYNGYRLFHPKGTDLLFGQKESKKSTKPPRMKKDGTPYKTKAPKQEDPILLFILRKRVVQKPDPWFPVGADLASAVDAGFGIYMSRNGGKIV